MRRRIGVKPKEAVEKLFFERRQEIAALQNIRKQVDSAPMEGAIPMAPGFFNSLYRLDNSNWHGIVGVMIERCF